MRSCCAAGMVVWKGFRGKGWKGEVRAKEGKRSGRRGGSTVGEVVLEGGRALAELVHKCLSLRGVQLAAGRAKDCR